VIWPDDTAVTSMTVAVVKVPPVSVIVSLTA